MDINELLKKAYALEASDLHIKVGSPPIVRIYGELAPLSTESKIGHEDAMKIALSVMTSGQADTFKKKTISIWLTAFRASEDSGAISLCRGEPWDLSSGLSR